MFRSADAVDHLRVLVHAPFGRDGQLIQSELINAGFEAKVCATVEEFCESMSEGAGAALIGDEALTPESVECIVEQMKKQPPWSDFPLLVMTSGGGSTDASRFRLGLLDPLGNVTLLERPLRPVTLVSTLRAALRARRHQYQISEHLERIERSEKALRMSEARFRFPNELGELTRILSRPEEVMALVAKRLGEHLGVSRCAYASVEPGSDEMNILRDYAVPGCASSVGIHRLPPFGETVAIELRSGRTLVIRNVKREVPPGEGQEMFLAMDIQAIICCPLVKAGELVAMMAVHQMEPRDWSDDEVELVREVGERSWAYIERERLLAEVAANNEMLHRTNADLMRVNRELEEFAYVASHDLQEPIRMVNIYTQLILQQLANADPTVVHYGDVVRQGAKRMEELIRDLLSFSRAVHTESVTVGAADLTASLAEAISVLKNRISENGAIISAGPLPVVRGDTPQLAHVFQNLISNSIKYRKASEIPQIQIAAEQKGEEWLVTVKDNGIGFDQAYAERIFGLFKRLHKEEYPGTGLGLSICQRIVERYGGRMWATSHPGEGATFFFALPRPAVI